MEACQPVAKKCKHEEEQNEAVATQNAGLLKEASDALLESNRIHVRPIVDETKLGIELFVGDRSGEFHGLIKCRYGDFIVHEIDLEGNVAKLSVLNAPEEQEPTSSLSLSDLVDADSYECISEVNSGYLDKYKIDVTGMDKDTRTSLHHAIRGAFDRVESSTVSESEIKDKKQNGDSTNNKKETNDKPDSTQSEVETPEEEKKSVETSEPSVDNNSTASSAVQPEKKYIVVTRRSKASRSRNVWPRDRPDHTHFILYKENKDTMEAIHNLAATVNMRPSNFSFAGTKDRRAVTSQWISVWRLEPKKMIMATRRFNKRPFMKVGNFCFKKEPLKLGQLKANKFDIVIRHLVHNNGGIEIIENSLNSIKEKGFVNYFGLQRFGTRTIQTHEIGLAILQTRWDKAIDLILSYRFDDNMQPPVADDKNATNQLDDDKTIGDSPKNVPSKNKDDKRWTNGAEQHNSFIDFWKAKHDAETVFKKYPHFRFTNEGIIMKSLSKSEESSENFLNAIVSLPRTTRSIYVHSYQSLLWNKLATYRLKKYGFKVVPGDLILPSESKISDNSLELLLTADKLESGGTDGDATAAAASDKTNEVDSSLSNQKTPIEEIESEIKIATEEDLDKYTIFDVVLPILGSRITLPKNSVGDEAIRLLKEDELTLESFRAREKLFICYGSYRKLMVRPNNIYWSIKQYSNPQQNLVETDLEHLNRELLSKETSKQVPSSPAKSDSSDEALIVSFELPPSSYATMCLREIMKKPSTEINSRF